MCIKKKVCESVCDDVIVYCIPAYNNRIWPMNLLHVSVSLSPSLSGVRGTYVMRIVLDIHVNGTQPARTATTYGTGLFS